MTKTWKWGWTLAIAGAVAACGDGDDGETGTTAAAEGAGASGTGGGSSGGADPGTGGGDGTGGAGGGSEACHAACLEAPGVDALLAISDPQVCVVARYEAPGLDASYLGPTWGTHGGPLALTSNATGVTLHRLTAPADTRGTLTDATSDVAADVPEGSFLGPAFDLPGLAATAFAYAGAFPETAGALHLVVDGEVVATHDVDGFFAAGVIAGANGDRVLYTGLSTLGTLTPAENALYAADACDDGPTLVPARGDCASPRKIAAWGEASGPVAVDTAGNAFALATVGADTEARAFAADAIAPGGTAVEGEVVFEMPGFGSSLAAVAPCGDAPGWLAFQPYDATTYAALDVVAQTYAVGAEGVTPLDPAPSALFDVARDNIPVSLMTSEDGLLWVGFPTTEGALCEPFSEGPCEGTTFVLLGRR